MKRSIALAAAATALVAGSAAANPAPPRIVFAQTAPFVIGGSHFVAGERVMVTAFVPGKTLTRGVTATPTGTFLVRFRTLKAPACGAYGARAIGNHGSRASVHFAPPECAPGPTTQ